MQKVLCCTGGGEELTRRWFYQTKNFSSVCLCEAGCDKKNLAVVLLSVNAIITYTFAMT